MTLPITPDPLDKNHQERRLNERAFFLGNFGRKTQEADPKKEQINRFNKLLSQSIGSPHNKDKGDDNDGYLSELTPHPTQSPLLDKATTPQGASAAEIDRITKKEAEKEAQRKGNWHGPPALMIGLAVMGINELKTEPLKPTESTPQKKSTELQSENGNLVTAQVLPKLIQALKKAGLKNPVTGLKDPRLAGLPKLDKSEGWKNYPTTGGTIFCWTSESAGQRLEWKKDSLTLQTYAEDDLQTITKQNDTINNRLAKMSEGDQIKFTIKRR